MEKGKRPDIDLNDAIWAAGAALVVAGVALIYIPAAIIIAGGLALTAAYHGVGRKG
jgi:hypothetical protein